MLRAVSRPLPLPALLCCSLLLAPHAARAGDDEWMGPGRSVTLEGGVAIPTGEYGSTYVGLAVPFRFGMGFQLTRLLWVEPFASLGWVKPISAESQTPRSGFRILAGAELQIHSTFDPLQPFDVYGGLHVAFERVVAHAFAENNCADCLPNASVTLSNGVAFGLRTGILFKATPDVRIGPYVGGQLSYMPSLAPLVTVYPSGVTTAVPLSHLQFWVEAGIRAAISTN
jgi:hypothetical protein